MLVVGDARYPPLVSSFRAHLIYADPPTNRGMNEGNSNDNLSVQQYRDFAYNWIQSILPHLATNSYFIICLYAPLRHLYEDLLFNYFPMLRFVQEIIWSYNFGLYTRKKFVPSHDNILIFKMGHPPFNWQAVAVESQRMQHKDKRADWRGRTPESVWHFNRVSGNNLDRKFLVGYRRSSQPEGLCKRIVLAYTDPGMIVWDVFSGSGTMKNVCDRYDRICVAMDICHEYMAEVKKRIDRERKLQDFLLER